MRLFSVWSAIESIKDGNLRLAMFTARDEEREALARAFPQCFSEEIVSIPASKFYAASKKFWESENNGSASEEEIYLQPMVMDECNLPHDHEWSDDRDAHPDKPPIPNEIWSQLVGKPLTKDIRVLEYQDKRYVIIWWLDSMHDNEYGEIISRPANSKLSIIVTSAEHINLNA